MNEKLTFDVALDQSLQRLAEGMSLAGCLARFPHYANELAPLLEAALVARAGLTPTIPKPNLARGKGQFMQAARRSESFAILRFAFAAALAVVVVALAGVGLTLASAPALPGDALYPIKLLAAQAELALTIDPAEREALQHRQAADRRHEIQLAAAQGRNAQVTFEGVVEERRGETLVVSGVLVRAGPARGGAGDVGPASGGVDVQVGDSIQVNATLRDGEVIADEINLLERAPLTPTAVLPTPTPEPARQATPTPTLIPTRQTVTRPSLTPTDPRPARTPTTIRPTSASATDTRSTSTPTANPTDSRPSETRPVNEPTPTPRSRP